MKSNRQKRIRGFTLMELLVVLAILGLLVSLVGPQVLNQLGGAKSKTARIQIRIWSRPWKCTSWMWAVSPQPMKVWRRW